MRPPRLRCAPSAIERQIDANRSKSYRLPDSNGNRSKCGITRPEEILEPARFPLERPVAAIGSDASASEVRFDRLKHLGAITVLADGEAWPHLPAHEQRGSRGNGDGEATFAVGVSGNVRREELATATARAGV